MMKSFLSRLLSRLLATAIAVAAIPAMAQQYPSKPIRILVGFAPGGAMDVVARTVAQKIAVGLGQPVVVDNKPGAASNIAIRQLIDSPPDGYTVMLVANGSRRIRSSTRSSRSIPTPTWCRSRWSRVCRW